MARALACPFSPRVNASVRSTCNSQRMHERSKHPLLPLPSPRGKIFFYYSLPANLLGKLELFFILWEHSMFGLFGRLVMFLIAFIVLLYGTHHDIYTFA